MTAIKHLRRLMGGLMLTSTLFHVDSTAATFDCTIDPRPEDAFEKAHYRMWIPESTPELRGIVFRQHGCGPGARELGLEHANDIQWQALAQKHGFALMSSQLWAPDEDCSTWTMPEDGSANAYLNAIQILANASGHPELETVPWCLWGHSGGAIWTVNMAYLYPERIVAAFPRSGGLTPLGRTYERSQPQTPDSNQSTLQVPILYCYGEREYVEGNRFYQLIAGVHQVFDYGRKNHAPWAVAVHPDSEHENSQSRQLALRFFDKMIDLRLPDPVDTQEDIPTLRTLPNEKHWVGVNRNAAIMDERDVQIPAQETSYLVDASFARAWQAFNQNGDIPDTTPPVAPHNVRVEIDHSKAKLQWAGFADVESGIQSFRIYRQGKLIGEIKGEHNDRWNPNDSYHAWNYSDQPLLGKQLPARTFTDTSPGNAQAEDYSITTVNKNGLESGKTHGISLTEWNRRQATPWTHLSYTEDQKDWQGPGGNAPKGWRTEQDILNMRPDRDNNQHTSLYTKELYGNFEFRFDYRIGLGGNSGVKYRMTDYDGRYLGPEYQILDDQQHYPGYDPATSDQKHYITATLYVLEMGDWNLDTRHPPGIWNEGRIVVKDKVIEHWHNGVKIIDTRTDTKAFKQAIQASKFNKWPHYAQNPEGRIMLQDHGTGVDYKNLRIKRLP